MTSGETFINSKWCKFDPYKWVEKCFNNNWILLEFLKTFIKVYVRQVFVDVWWNFIFSGHNVWQVLKNYLQPCREIFQNSIIDADLIPSWQYGDGLSLPPYYYYFPYYLASTTLKLLSQLFGVRAFSLFYGSVWCF